MNDAGTVEPSSPSFNGDGTHALHHARKEAPSLALMHFSAFLTGVGTLLLGPILPLLSLRWHLADEQAGLLLLAQFCGSFTGGVSTGPRLRSGLMTGLLAAAIGMAGFAYAPKLPLACTAIALGGFGIGRVITVNNIVAGRRYAAARGSALARLNFSWSLGALASPVLTAALTPHIRLSSLLAVFAGLLLLASILFLRQTHTMPPEPVAAVDAQGQTGRFPRQVFLFFAALLFLYGGLETCLSGWLTTFALRYGKTSLVLSEYTLVLLLAGLTAGRAAASWLMLRVGERTAMRLGLALSAIFACSLAVAHEPRTIAAAAVLLGFALAPIFPATFAWLLAYQPPARAAGVILAVSGLGAAGLPWLMGVLSTRTGSLQIALTVPAATAALMLLLSFSWGRSNSAKTPLFPASGHV